MSHEAQHGEHDNTAEDGCQAIDHGDEYCVLEAVLVLLVIAGKCENTTAPRSKRENGLSGCVRPNGYGGQLLPLGQYKVLQAV